GGVDGLVDHHPVRHVDAVQQFVRGDAQGRPLDMVDLPDLAIDESREFRVQLGDMPEDAAHQVLEVLEVGDFMRLLVRELRDHLLGVAARYLPGVDRLQRAATRTRPCDRVDAILAARPGLASGLAGGHGSCSSSWTISMATCAASSPLLPWLPPARFSASACSSTASTPLQTGRR